MNAPLLSPSPLKESMIVHSNYQSLDVSLLDGSLKRGIAILTYCAPCVDGPCLCRAGRMAHDTLTI